jgi:hypothetical protein
MNSIQVQQEIAIIKDMIEKSRRETAESGHFFIGIGLLGIVATPLVGLLESVHLNRLVLPLFVLITFVSGGIGYLTVGRRLKKERVKSYPKTICYQVLLACSIPALMILFLFPLLRVYSWSLVPVLTSLIMGIMVYSAGTIFEIGPIRWCGVSWWLGALLLALSPAKPWIRISIMNLSIMTGFVLPGLILNRKYRERTARNGS